MKDEKLRCEAMLKNYTLSTLLKNAANKEDVKHQAINIEKVGHPDAANRVYEQKKSCHPFKNSVNRLQNQGRRNTGNQLVRNPSNQPQPNSEEKELLLLWSESSWTTQ